MTEKRYTMDSYGRIVAADMGLTRYVKVEDLFRCETCKHGDNGLCNAFMWCEHHEEYIPDIRKLNVTADVQEVKHGRWEEIRNPYGELEGWICKCGRQVVSKDNYCPNCGAKMD